MVQLLNQPETVTTDVRYLAERWRGSIERPRILDGKSRRANTEKHGVSVVNARFQGQPKRIDKNGFELVNFKSPISRFDQDDLIKQTYYPAVANLVKVRMGASEVYVTHHLIRTEDKADFNKAYARFVHCDYDLKTARQKSFNLLKDKGKNPSQYEHAQFAWYNTWQPFDNPVYHNPLALLDAETIESEDIVSYLYAGNGKDFESSIPLFNPNHVFYYYAEMTTEEALIIKQQDTREGYAPVAPHTSFVDPTSDDSAPPRRSIEVRMMAVFE